MPTWHPAFQVRSNKCYYSNYQQRKQEVKLGYTLTQRKSGHQKEKSQVNRS